MLLSFEQFSAAVTAWQNIHEGIHRLNPSIPLPFPRKEGDGDALVDLLNTSCGLPVGEDLFHWWAFSKASKIIVNGYGKKYDVYTLEGLYNYLRDAYGDDSGKQHTRGHFHPIRYFDAAVTNDGLVLCLFATRADTEEFFFSMCEEYAYEQYCADVDKGTFQENKSYLDYMLAVPKKLLPHLDCFRVM